MVEHIPRLAIAGTGSGCGKTTVTCALLAALTRRGLRAGSLKCGPDYIDPMFHREIFGVKTGNLDLFFFDEKTARYLLARNGAGRDICILEGVMGYYDGIGMTTRAGTYETAKAAGCPAVLVVDARGAALSVLAVLHGFLTMVPESGIRGVILNRCSAGMYKRLKPAICERFGGAVKPLGYLPELPECALKSRRLGLVTAGEVTDIRAKMTRLADAAERSLDLDGLLGLAGSAEPLSFESVCPAVFAEQSCPESTRPAILTESLQAAVFAEPVRIGVARDEAFCFYYEENLDLLTEMGAELVPFSPLRDAALPPDLHGLYLGGGYPELHAWELAENAAMRAAVREALARAIPCIAECGGFMYLTQEIGGEPMVGFLPGVCEDAGRLVRFGYAELTAERDNLLCSAGETLRAHEFHYWDATETGSGFAAKKRSGMTWQCGFANERLYAGFPHFHFYSSPKIAVNFYRACLEEKHRYDADYQTFGN